MCQGFSHISGVLYHFVLAKLATSSVKVSITMITYLSVPLFLVYDEENPDCLLLDNPPEEDPELVLAGYSLSLGSVPRLLEKGYPPEPPLGCDD